MSSSMNDSESRKERERRKAQRVENIAHYRSAIMNTVGSSTQAPKDDKRSGFIHTLKYDNSLPELPVSERLINYDFPEDHAFVHDILNTMSLDSKFPRQYYPEPDLGIFGFMMDPLMYQIPTTPPVLNEVDADITSKKYDGPAVSRAVGDVEDKDIDWLMTSQHISNDLHNDTYKYGDKEQVRDDHLARNIAVLNARLAGDIRQRISTSFQIANSPDTIVDPTGKNLRPVRVWSLLPDPNAGALNLVACAFTDSPDDALDRESRKEPDLLPSVKRARLSQAILRTSSSGAVNLKVKNASLLLHLPVPSSLPKNSIVEGNSAFPTVPFTSAVQPIRDYTMSVEHGPKNGTIAIAFRDDGVAHFAPVRARASMSRVPPSKEHPILTKPVRVEKRPLAPGERDDLTVWKGRIGEVSSSDVEVALSRKKLREELVDMAKLKKQSEIQKPTVESTELVVSNDMEIDTPVDNL